MHTKGKWTVGKNGLSVWHKGRCIVQCFTQSVKTSEDEHLANAHRICTCVNGWDDLEAENKALREALKRLIKQVEGSSQGATYNEEREIDKAKALLAGKGVDGT